MLKSFLLDYLSSSLVRTGKWSEVMVVLVGVLVVLIEILVKGSGGSGRSSAVEGSLLVTPARSWCQLLQLFGLGNLYKQRTPSLYKQRVSKL